MHRGQRRAVQGCGAGYQLQCLLCRCGTPACLSKLQHQSTSFLTKKCFFYTKDAVCSICQDLFPAHLKSSLHVQTGAALAHVAPLVGQTNLDMLSLLLVLARCGCTGGVGFSDDVSQIVNINQTTFPVSRTQQRSQQTKQTQAMTASRVTASRVTASRVTASRVTASRVTACGNSSSGSQKGSSVQSV